MATSSSRLERQTLIVDKPWGRFLQYTLNEVTTVKIIEVQPGGKLSLQSHKNREELWIFLDDGAEVHVDDQVIRPRIGEEVRIPRGSKHRVMSAENRVRFMEIAFGEFDENDIIRYEDSYGRA